MKHTGSTSVSVSLRFLAIVLVVGVRNLGEFNEL